MRVSLFIIFFMACLSGQAFAQIKVEVIDTTNHGVHDMGYFFTNRPLKKSDSEEVDFRNRWTRQTGNLRFCLYDYDNDFFHLKYQATKTCHKSVYPTDFVEDNIFYKVYEDLRLERGIHNIVFVIPGYGKTFKKQVNDFMYRMQETYYDSLRGSTAMILFAWGDQSLAPFYYKGRRSANRAANDFAIFQQLLESFQNDSAYFADKPNDVSFTLVCSSMGNQLLKRYLLKREKQGIELVKSYKRVVMVGSDAGCDSFEDGKGFHSITAMTDYVLILVNRTDGPLGISKYMNMKNRLGAAGPTNWEELSDSIHIMDVTNLIDWQDVSTMGHDYLLRNPKIRARLIYEKSRLEQEDKQE